MKDVRKYLLEAEQRFGSNIACTIAGQSYSYQMLFSKAYELVARIPEKAERIGVIANNDIDTYASILAIWISEKTYVPIVKGNFPAHISLIDELSVEFILNDLDNTIYQTDKNRLEVNDIAYILSTSGTTGKPKQIPISYNNLSAFVESFLALELDLSPNDRFLQMADLCFDMSIISFLIPLCVGASFHTLEERNHKSFSLLSTCDAQDLTVLVCSPSAVELIRNYFDEIELKSVRLTLFGAENLKTDLAKKWLNCTPNGTVYNLYGPTEGGIFCFSHPFNPTEDLDASVPIGKSAKNIEYLVQENELLISGKQVFAGYQNSDKNPFLKIKDVFWYKTGDLVKVNKHGQLVFEKRKDQEVKYLGKRINLSFIEHNAKEWLTIRNSNYHIEIEYTENRHVNIRISSEQQTDTEALKNFIESNIPVFYPPIKLSLH